MHQAKPYTGIWECLVYALGQWTVLKMSSGCLNSLLLIAYDPNAEVYCVDFSHRKYNNILTNLSVYLSISLQEMFYDDTVGVREKYEYS